MHSTSQMHSYDITGSQFGVMLVPDQAQALGQTVRATKPGGRVLLIAYGDPQEFEALHFFIAAVQAVVPGFEGPAEDEPMLEFQVADPKVLRQRLIDAGLTDVIVDKQHQERLEDEDLGSSCGTGALAATPSRACWLRTWTGPASRRHHPGPRRHGPRALRRPGHRRTDASTP